MRIRVTPEGNRAKCWKYARGARPVWTFDGVTLWCSECGKGSCGISTLGLYGRGYWPDGFELPLFAERSE